MKHLIVWLLCVLLTTCHISPLAVNAQNNDELFVFAASSLTDVFTELADEFEEISNLQVTLNFAGSSTLSAQLLQGAPADIFASANLEQMLTLVDEGLVLDNTITVFAENELVLITPVDNPAEIASIKDLGNSNILLVVAAPTVPIREYTDILLDNLVELYGNHFPESVDQNIVSEELNVRQIVTRVALGEADAGIVYRTDITEDIVQDVQIIPLPLGASPRAKYVIAPLIENENSENATYFIDFVLSDTGQSILQSWGFCSPEDLLPELTPEPEETSEPDEIQEIDTSC